METKLNEKQIKKKESATFNRRKLLHIRNSLVSWRFVSKHLVG